MTPLSDFFSSFAARVPEDDPHYFLWVSPPERILGAFSPPEKKRSLSPDLIKLFLLRWWKKPLF